MKNYSQKVEKIYILANGCHESYVDTTLLESYFCKNPSFMQVKQLDQADLILFLGCSVMKIKEEETLETIKTLNEQKRPDTKLLVAGCISKVRPEIVPSYGQYADNVKKIDGLLRLNKEAQEIAAHFPYQPYRGKQGTVIDDVRLKARASKIAYYSSLSGKIPMRLSKFISSITTNILNKYKDFVEANVDVWNEKTFAVKISTGCAGNCTYCSIKQSRGDVCSKPLEAVINEIQVGLKDGYLDFALIGTDIGDYGRDIGTNLLELLKSIIALPAPIQLRLRNVNPRWLIPNCEALIDLIKTGKISYIQSPIQSCSNKILKRMNRGYKAEDYISSIEKIRDNSSSVFLKSQIITGFPGESDEDFKASLKLFKSGLFNYIDVFEYTSRPNTVATTFLDLINPEIIIKRRKKLILKSLFQLAPKQMFRQGISFFVKSKAVA